MKKKWLAPIMLLCALIPMANSFAVGGGATVNSVPISLTREIWDVVNPVTVQFTYELTADENNPAELKGLQNQTIDFTNVMPNDARIANKSVPILLENVVFSKVGDYLIHVKEIASSDAVNYPVDKDHRYEIMVSVRNVMKNDLPTGELVATAWGYCINENVGNKKEDRMVFGSRAVRSYIEIQKTVVGDSGDLDEYFKFRIDLNTKLLGSGDKLLITGQDREINYMGQKIITQQYFVKGQDNFVYLKSGQKVRIGQGNGWNEVPIGVKYSLLELDANSYATYIDGVNENGKLVEEKQTITVEENAALLINDGVSKAGTANVTRFENVRNSTVWTGVRSVLVPFVVIGVVAVAGLTSYYVLVKKK